jgi:hypothetical protein
MPTQETVIPFAPTSAPGDAEQLDRAGQSIHASIDLQRILNSDTYIKIFGRTRIGLPGWKLHVLPELQRLERYERRAFSKRQQSPSTSQLPLHARQHALFVQDPF